MHCLLLFLVIFGVFSMDSLKCWRGGVFNEKENTCDCPKEWKNIQSPGKCESKACPSGTGPDRWDVCECTEHWEGLNCDICKSSSACSGVETCRKSLESHEELHMNCNVESEYLRPIVGNITSWQYFNVVKSVKKEHFGNGFFQGWEVNDGFQKEIFWCNLYNCKLEELSGNENLYLCNSTYCECNLGPLGSKICEDMEIQYVVKNLRGYAEVQCSEKGACRFKHENFPAFVDMKCFGGECYNIL